MKPIHNGDRNSICDQRVVIPHKVNDLNETNSQQTRNLDEATESCDSSQS